MSITFVPATTPKDLNCAICLVDFNEKDAVVGHQDIKGKDSKKIVHFFHPECVDSWINGKEKPTCPSCRTPIKAKHLNYNLRAMAKDALIGGAYGISMVGLPTLAVATRPAYPVISAIVTLAALIQCLFSSGIGGINRENSQKVMLGLSAVMAIAVFGASLAISEEVLGNNVSSIRGEAVEKIASLGALAAGSIAATAAQLTLSVNQVPLNKHKIEAVAGAGLLVGAAGGVITGVTTSLAGFAVGMFAILSFMYLAGALGSIVGRAMHSNSNRNS